MVGQPWRWLWDHCEHDNTVSPESLSAPLEQNDAVTDVVFPLDSRAISSPYSQAGQQCPAWSCSVPYLWGWELGRNSPVDGGGEELFTQDCLELLGQDFLLLHAAVVLQGEDHWVIRGLESSRHSSRSASVGLKCISSSMESFVSSRDLHTPPILQHPPYPISPLHPPSPHVTCAPPHVFMGPWPLL